ncbi:MAG: hypothetical protein COX65_08915, partial [Elusimicrobia bacterium CG_4_10_14_0_2_um_filter_56_8]
MEPIMKKIIFAISLFALGWAAPLQAEIMTYQGRLKESSIPVIGNRYFIFNLCNDEFAGTCTPTLTQPFAVANGLFKSTFTIPAVDLSQGQWFLEVSVGLTAGSESALSPRERLTAVPFSVYASSAASASSLAAGSGYGVISSTHMVVLGSLSASDTGIQVSTFALVNAYAQLQNDNPGGQDLRVGVYGRVDSASAEAGDMMAAGNFETEVPAGKNGMMVGLRAANRNYGSSPRAVGLLVDSLQNTGAGGITDTYGVWISTLTDGAQTNQPFALYSEDSNARTYFAGDVGIGAAMPLAPLHVNVGNSGFLAVSYNDTAAGWGDIAFLDNTSGNRKWGVGAFADSHPVMPNSWYLWQNVDKNETAVSKYRIIASDTGNVGISSDTPKYRLVVSSGAGETGTIMAVSTGNTNVFWVAGDGAHATYFYGDGSGLTGVTGATGTDPDALPKAGGTMAGPISMGGNDINSISSITVSGEVTALRYQINGSTVIALLPGNGSLAVGPMAGAVNTGVYNLFVGSAAGKVNTTGIHNVLVGYGAGSTNTSGTGNTFIGSSAGSANATGLQNIVIGYNQQTSASNSASELNIGGLLFGRLGEKSVGISTRNPQAALDIVSTATGAGYFAQIWRDGNGAIQSSMSATGVMMANKFVGDGSGITGLGSADNVTGTVAIANGGTNSSTALTGSAIMVSNLAGNRIEQGPSGSVTTVLHGNAGGA